jgi:hypothetical protein
VQNGTNLSHLLVVELECRFSMGSLLLVEMIGLGYCRSAVWDTEVGEPFVAATMLAYFVVFEIFVVYPMQKASRPHLAS